MIGWPETLPVAKDEPGLLILSTSGCWEHRCVPLDLLCAVLGIEPRAS